MEPPLKKEMVPVMRRPDEWKDPWRRSKSPRRRPGLGSPPRGRRRHRPSGSSASLSGSSRYLETNLAVMGRQSCLHDVMQLMCVFQVNVSLLILHGLGVVPLPQPLLVFQFLLQPLLPAQLLQRQPVEVRAPCWIRHGLKVAFLFGLCSNWSECH